MSGGDPEELGPIEVGESATLTLEKAYEGEAYAATLRIAFDDRELEARLVAEFDRSVEDLDATTPANRLTIRPADLPLSKRKALAQYGRVVEIVREKMPLDASFDPVNVAGHLIELLASKNSRIAELEDDAETAVDSAVELSQTPKGGGSAYVVEPVVDGDGWVAWRYGEPSDYETAPSPAAAVARLAGDRDVSREELVELARGELPASVGFGETTWDEAAGKIVDAILERLGGAELPDVDESWTPTSENVNALPDPIRDWIHDLETRADPAGDLRRLRVAEDVVRQLSAALDEAESALRNVDASLEERVEAAERLDEARRFGESDDDVCACGHPRAGHMKSGDYGVRKGQCRYAPDCPCREFRLERAAGSRGTVADRVFVALTRSWTVEGDSLVPAADARYSDVETVAREIRRYAFGDGVGEPEPVDEVLAEIRAERRRQDERWGPPDERDHLTLTDLLAIAAEEAGEFAEAALETRYGGSQSSEKGLDPRREALQLAAAGAMIVEWLDENDGWRERR